MQKKEFGEEQIIGILRAAEREDESIGDLCRDHGIAENAFCHWRQKYGDLQVPEVKRQRDLEQENACLKRRLVESRLEIDAVRELPAKNC